MKSGKCPKCGSSNVRHKPGLWKWSDSGRIPGGAGWMAGIPVARYVCVECGFVETYVAKKKDRRKVAEKWPLATRAPEE